MQSRRLTARSLAQAKLPRAPAAVHPPAATPQPTQDMVNQLEALKARTTVVADTGDFESARTHRRAD